MVKAKSRPARWQEACSEARAALDELKTALDALNDLRAEYEEWQSNLPEGLASSTLGDKLATIVDMDFEGCLSEVEDVVGEAEDADLPLGFGKD